MSRSCLAVHHVRFEDAGSFAPVLAQHGYRLLSRHAAAVTQAEWLEADLVLVLGGPIGVNDTERYPWLAPELATLGQRLRQRGPTLGICLGAQLMAAAIGGHVVPRSAGMEIGWSALELGAQPGPLQALHGVPVLHWHGDNIVLPEGVTALASSEHTPCQAFALDDYALGLQFHVEFEESALEEWLTGHAVELQRAGIDLARLRGDTREHGADLIRHGRQLLANWLSAIKP